MTKTQTNLIECWQCGGFGYLIESVCCGSTFHGHCCENPVPVKVDCPECVDGLIKIEVYNDKENHF